MAGNSYISWQQRVDTVIDRLEKIRLSQQNWLVNPSLDAQFELSKLSQIGSVLDYQIEFEKLSSKTTETHELILVSLFISGLKPEIRWELQLNRPSTLKEAFASARYHESRLEDLKHAVTEVEDISKLRVNRVNVELPSFESEAKAKEVDDELIGLAVESKTTENIFDECYCNMGEIVELTYQTEEIEEVKNATESSQSPTVPPLPMELRQVDRIQGLICHVPKTQPLNNRSTCMFVGVRSILVPATLFQLSSLQRRELLHRDGPWIDSSYKMSQLIFGLFFLNVARGGIALKFYALEEVYKDSLDFHLEDKVDLKESGMIHP